jgi:hypothetical protein
MWSKSMKMKKLLLLILFSALEIKNEEYSDFQILASVDYNDCFSDSDECWSNGGPHVVFRIFNYLLP